MELSGSCVMNIRFKRNLCIEMHKFLNNSNPSFMRFLKSSELKVLFAKNIILNINLGILRVNLVSFGTKSLRSSGQNFWNSFPYHIISAESLECFKKSLKAGIVSFALVQSNFPPLLRLPITAKRYTWDEVSVCRK